MARPVASHEQFAARFWAKVDKAPGHGPGGNCWIWTGSVLPASRTSRGGYGHLRWNRQNLLAHRTAFTIENGTIPDRLCVLHACDNPRCVRPEHLFLGTKAENTQDMMRKGRHRAPCGEANASARLTSADVVRIRELYAARLAGSTTLARRFGIPESSVSRIVRGLSWKTAGGPLSARRGPGGSTDVALEAVGA